MWRIKKATGELLRDNCESSYQLLRTAFHKDGTPFKKAEANLVSSGTTVLRKQGITATSQYSVEKNGKEVPVHSKIYGEIFVPCIIEEY